MSQEILLPRDQLYYLLEELSVDHDNVVSDTKGIVTQEFNRRFGTNHRATELRG